MGDNDNKKNLIGNKCKKCGQVYFPKKFLLCSSCFSEDSLEDVRLSGRGKLYAFSIARTAPPAYSRFDLPYGFGYVDLEEGVRVFSMFMDCEPFEEKLRIGCPMEVVYLDEKASGEQGTIEYKFRPV